MFIKEELPLEIMNKIIATTCPYPNFNILIVQKHLNNLNTLKSVGPEKFHPKVLRECADSMAFPLLLIFEKSFNTGEIPKLWSCANVIPLLKKG